jgi:hypothetical protein
LAILLDERAQETISRRRARDKNRDLFLRVERGSMRAGVPYVLVVDWAPRHRRQHELVSHRQDGINVYLDRRTARYVQFRDLTITMAHLGPFEWPVLTDPFALDKMREWEYLHPEVSLPPAGEACKVARREHPEPEVVLVAGKVGEHSR